jgi:hypothetical protein
MDEVVIRAASPWNKGLASTEVVEIFAEVRRAELRI